MAILDARREPLDARPTVTRPDPNDHRSIHAIIDDCAVRTVFQPVVHLASGSIVGFEALSRGPAGSHLESPEALLGAARDVGRLGELDWLCRVHAMEAAVAADLHPSLSWLINVEPAGLDIACPDHLANALYRARTELRVVLEVVERNLDGRVTDLLRAVDQARRDSWGVALDDVGAEESSLALLPFLRPDVVKLDMALVCDVSQHAAAAITATVRAYAERTQTVILAEGIETEEHEQLARVFGATYGQGYRYGRPGPLPKSVPAPRNVIPLSQRLSPPEVGTPFEVLSELKQPERSSKEHLIHISRHLEEQSALGRDAAVLLASFQDRKYFPAARQQRYEDLSRTNALTVVIADDLPLRSEPRYQMAPLAPGSRMRQEWAVLVISPYYAGAFVARDCGDTGPDEKRRFDYIYTNDPDAVVTAARRFLQELKPLDDIAEFAAGPQDDAPGPSADANLRRSRLAWGRPRH